jgi:hypothetical protein
MMLAPIFSTSFINRIVPRCRVDLNASSSSSAEVPAGGKAGGGWGGGGGRSLAGWAGPYRASRRSCANATSLQPST